MTGWEPNSHNPLISAPASPTIKDMTKPEPVSRAWPFAIIDVGDPEEGYPVINLAD